jgi:hypothetical protein
VSGPAGLLAPWTGRWQIERCPGGLDVWAATRRSDDGRQIRYIVARTAAELAAKLEAADSEGATPS